MQTYVHGVLEELPEEPKAGHTPEPWVADDGDGQYFGIFDASGSALAYLIDFHDDEPVPVPGEYIAGYALGSEDIGWKVNRDEHRANARRIVACVNACAGIPTLELEIARLPSAPKNIVERQRDALLALLKKIEPDLAYGTTGQYKGHGSDHIRSAIAAVESGKVPS